MAFLPTLRKHHVRERLARSRQRPTAGFDFRLLFVILLGFRLFLFNPRRFFILFRPLGVRWIYAFSEHSLRLSLEFIQLSRAEMAIVYVASQTVHRFRGAIPDGNLLLHLHLILVIIEKIFIFN